MSEKELIIQEEAKSGVCILHLSGEITKSSGDALLQWRNWESGLPEGLTSLLLDFSKVSYINSAGIAALIRLFRMGNGGGYRSFCFGLHYHYEKLFAMVGIHKYLTIFLSEWDAVEKINSGSL